VANLPALDGTAVERARKAMSLTQVELASVLGIHPITLHKWEATGFFTNHKSAAATVMRWIASLSGSELETLSQMIREHLAKKRLIECQLELTIIVLQSSRGARSPVPTAGLSRRSRVG
jgi:DNA-binding XRE family transcriptional regulator